jgi:hypothetical protein
MPRLSVNDLIYKFVDHPFEGWTNSKLNASGGCFYSRGHKLAECVELDPLTFVSVRWLDPAAPLVPKRHLMELHKAIPGAILLPRFGASLDETVESYLRFPDERHRGPAVRYCTTAVATTELPSPAAQAATLFTPGDPRPPVVSPAYADPMQATCGTMEQLFRDYAQHPTNYNRFGMLFVRAHIGSLYASPRLRIAMFDEESKMFYRLIEHHDNDVQSMLNLLAGYIPQAVPVPFLTLDYDVENHLLNLDTFNTRLADNRAALQVHVRHRMTARKQFRAMVRNHEAMIKYAEIFCLNLEAMAERFTQPYEPLTADEMNKISSLFGDAYAQLPLIL